MLDTLNTKYFLLSNLSDLKPKIKDDDIAICCPICREGNSWNKKQRCHLYYDHNIKSDLVKCFNCGFTGSMLTFLKTIKSPYLQEYKNLQRQRWLLNLKNNKKTTSIYNINKNKNDENKFLLFDKPNEFIKIDGTPAEKYLEKRKLLKYKNLFYYSKYNINIDNKKILSENSIVIPLMYEDKWYGFQTRMLDKKIFNIFLPNENKGYKAWNLFNTGDNVFIFESVFDALSSGLPLNYVIAGLGSDVSTHILEKFNRVIFCFDNQHFDETARKKSLELIDNNYVFIFPKHWNGRQIVEKDLNEMLQNGWQEEEIKEMILKNLYKGWKGKLLLRIN